MKSETKKSKRLDLQGIRGLAILSVLGFHFYPNYFPNGYLGVDQFFVLSGFLMCMLLKRSENMSIFSLISLFYSRRFKRILPLYLLLMFCSLIALFTVFPDSAIEINTQSASKALLFLSNRPKTDEEDYFEALSFALDIFTHTWSLSVEIQFYFIVPLIFLIANRFQSKKYQSALYVSIAVASYLFYTFTDDNQAFNSVFARCWQFITGMLVYLQSTNPLSEMNKKDDNTLFELLKRNEQLRLIENGNVNYGNIRKCQEIKNSKQMKIDYHILKYVILLLSVTFTMNSLLIPAIISRPFITVSTGILMYLSIDDYFLSNKFLTYFGDISYSLYLIHWPIYSYWKLTFNSDQFMLVAALIASIVLAVIIYETFEKWYLKISSTSIGLLVVLLFVSNVIMINESEIEEVFYRDDFTRLDFDTLNFTLDDAEKQNYQWDKNDVKNVIPRSCEYVNVSMTPPAGECIYKELDKKNKYIISSIGNSWAPNHGDVLYQECKWKVNAMQQLSFGLCEPLHPSELRTYCDDSLEQYESFLEKYKPDYAFIFTRFFSTGDPFPEGVTDVENDPIYQFMRNQLTKYTKHIKKKLFILNAMPRINATQVERIVKNIRANKTSEEIDHDLVYLGKYETARERHAQLIQDCGERCESIDYFNEFYNNSTGTFHYFDEKNGLSYFTYNNHLTFHGLEKIRHIYHDICKKL